MTSSPSLSPSVSPSPSSPSLSVTPSHIRSHLFYLHQFHHLHTNPLTNTDSFLRHSIQRYQNYLTLLASSSSLLPPLDVALVFHTHLLNPHHFYTYSIQNHGIILSPSFFLDGKKEVEQLEESKRKWEEKGWKWEASEVVSDDSASPSLSSLESYLIPAIQRQRSFTAKMFYRRFTDVQLLHSLSKYSQFISFIGNSGVTAVPTLEIDLAWHTHQLLPRSYIEYTSDVCGFVVNHDDSIEEEELNTGWEVTQSKWKEMFGEDYLSPSPVTNSSLESDGGSCGSKCGGGGKCGGREGKVVSSPSACSPGTCSGCGAGKCNSRVGLNGTCGSACGGKSNPSNGDSARGSCSGICLRTASSNTDSARGSCSGICLRTASPDSDSARGSCSGICLRTASPDSDSARGSCGGICVRTASSNTDSARGSCGGICLRTASSNTDSARGSCGGICVRTASSNTDSARGSCSGICLRTASSNTDSARGSCGGICVRIASSNTDSARGSCSGICLRTASSNTDLARGSCSGICLRTASSNTDSTRGSCGGICFRNALSKTDSARGSCGGICFRQNQPGSIQSGGSFAGKQTPSVQCGGKSCAGKTVQCGGKSCAGKMVQCGGKSCAGKMMVQCGGKSCAGKMMVQCGGKSCAGKMMVQCGGKSCAGKMIQGGDSNSNPNSPQDGSVNQEGGSCGGSKCGGGGKCGGKNMDHGSCSGCGAGKCSHRPPAECATCQPKQDDDCGCRTQTLTQFWLQHLMPSVATV